MASSSKQIKKKNFSADQLVALLKNNTTSHNKSAEKFDPIQFLQNQKIFSPLIIISNESIRIQRLVEWLREDFFGLNKDSTTTCHGSQLTSSAALQQIISSTQNLSLFQKYQLLVIHEADQVKAATTKLLLPALKQSSPSSFVIITAKTINQKTTLLNELSLTGTVVEISQLQGPGLKRWIEKEATRSGSNGITSDATELLAQAYGENISGLSQELSKLSLLTSSKEKISRTLVEQTLLKTPERNSFELIQQVAKKNLLGALNLLQELLDQGLHPLQLSSFLSRAIRMLLAQKGPAQEINSELTNFWFKKNLGSAASSFTEPQLTSAIELLKHLDLSLKSNGLPDELALSIFLQRLATKQLPAQ